jgi:uncharacterized protein (DUF342 family)
VGEARGAVLAAIAEDVSSSLEPQTAQRILLGWKIVAAQRFTVRVAQDRLAAFVTLTPGDPIAEPAHEVLTAVRAAVAAAGVVAFVDEGSLQRLVELARAARQQPLELQVATGAPPREGRDGRVETAFAPGPAPGHLAADGHMDFFDRELLKSVLVEQVVATIVPPELGQPGLGVDGRSLEAPPGRAATLALGAGVRLEEEGRVRARRNGVVLYKPGELLDVVERHVHRGPVDLHSGHLEMRGSLVVMGDVERLLHARATGDVEVLGAVRGSLRAGGSLRVTGVVRGGDTSKVVAEHDATLRSCEAAEVVAGGTLTVNDSVNSLLQGRRVVVAGRMRGGVASAEERLVVEEAGTPHGTSTVLRAGEPLELPDLVEVQRAVVMQNLRRMAERRGVRESVGARGPARAKGGKLGRADAADAAAELRERAAFAARRAALERHAVIEVGLGHVGLELRIGAAHLCLEQPGRGLRYAQDPATGQLRVERRDV